MPGLTHQGPRRASAVITVIVLTLCEPAGLAAVTPGVLAPGTTVAAVTAYGPIRIDARPRAGRRYQFIRGERRARLSAGGAPVGSHGASYTGPSQGTAGRLRVIEAYHDFDNPSDALIWLAIRRLHFAYNNHGLVVGWRRHDQELVVELWQFTINGRRPQTLPGANDRAVQRVSMARR